MKFFWQRIAGWFCSAGRPSPARPRLQATGWLCVLGLLLLASVGVGCRATLLRPNLRVPPASRSANASGIAEISRVSVYTNTQGTVEGRSLRAFRVALRRTLLNSNVFARVRFPDSIGPAPAAVGTHFEFRLNVIEDGEFDWRITWPAVYPMPGYWPLQQKSGKVTATMEVIAYRGEQKVMEQKFSRSRPYDIDFYAFYRTSPIEKESRACLYELLADVGNAIAKHPFTPIATPGKAAP